MKVMRIGSATRTDLSAGPISRAIAFAAFRDPLAELAPRVQFRNSETLGLYVGSIVATIAGLVMVSGLIGNPHHTALVLSIAAWLWLSLLLANFANASAVW
jgi:potassium-transporting ATPase ATP-binding subunit